MIADSIDTRANPDDLDHEKLLIAGIATRLPPGRQIAIPAGKRRVEIRRPNGDRTTWTLNVEPASHTPSPVVRRGARPGVRLEAPPEK